MKIKNKRKAKCISALGVAILLSFTGCKKQETNLCFQKQDISVEENEEKKVCLSSCQVLIENCNDGSVKHHFINKDYDDRSLEENKNYKKFDYDYQAITDKNIFSVSKIVYNTENYFVYEEIPETNGEYIYDYNVPYYMMDIRDLSLPEGYSLDEFYSLNNLKELEEKLNNSIYEKKHEYEDYYISDLHLVEVDGEILCFDFSDLPVKVNETTNVEDVTKLRTVYYIPCIGNDLINLKVSSGMTEVEEEEKGFYTYNIRENFVIEDVTGLNKSISDDLKGKVLKTQINYLSGKYWGKISNDKVKEILDKLNDPDSKQERKMNNYLEKLFETDNVKVSYNYSTLYISKKKGTNEKELPSDFYEKLNTLIKEENVHSIHFSNLDNTFDFTKIDFSNITSLDIFCVSNLKPFLEFLIDRNIFFESVDIRNYHYIRIDDEASKDEQERTISDEEMNLLGKLNTTHLSIEGAGFNQENPLNLDVELNENIQSLSIEPFDSCDYFEAYYDIYNVTSGKIGKVNIKSKAKELNIDFYKAVITENTKLSLPDDTSLSLDNVECKNVSVFDDLANVSYLYFIESIGPGLEADTSGALIYCKDKERNFYDAMDYTGIPLDVYREYKDVLRDLKKYYELTKIKNKLNISEKENSKYFWTPSIGDIVNLKDDNICIYKNAKDLKNKQNSVTSLYGTSILRRIQSIVMINDNGDQVVIDNMEDYEMYESYGFKVIGYYLVNQYSLNSDNTLTTECICSEDDLNLERTIPFR